MRALLLASALLVAPVGAAQPALSASPNPFDGDADSTIVLRNTGLEALTLDSLSFATVEAGDTFGLSWFVTVSARRDGERTRAEILCEPFLYDGCIVIPEEFFALDLAPSDSLVLERLALNCEICRGDFEYDDTLRVYVRGVPEPFEVVIDDYVVPTAAEDGPDAPAPLVVFPNPTRGAATVRLEAPAPGRVEVRVTDALGRVVARAGLEAPRGPVRVPLSLEALPAGRYAVEARVGAARWRGAVVVVE